MLERNAIKCQKNVDSTWTGRVCGGRGLNELFEFEGGRGVLGLGAIPSEEAEGFRRGSSVADTEDAVDDL